MNHNIRILDPARWLLLLGLFITVGLGVAATPIVGQVDVDIRYHVVAPGETLSEIAKQYDVDVDTLTILNGISDADEIFAGQQLRLPRSVVSSIPGEQATTESDRESEGDQTKRSGPAGLRVDESEATADGHESADAKPTKEAVESATPKASEPSPATIDSVPRMIVDPMLATTRNRTYTVRLNDTLADVALRTGVSHAALSKLNRLTRDAPLRAGQSLLLPATPRDLQMTTPAQTVIVQPGDSLSAIAVEHEIALPDLMRANGLSNPDAIVIGQSLIVPPKPLQAEEQMRRRVGPPRSGFDYYTVQQGDTLSEIGRDFDTPVLALLEYNGLPDEQTVYSGLELRIPFGAPPLPQVLPPAPISGTSFMVSLSRQQCWLFHGSEIAQSWTCSTGYGDWITRTGTFKIQTKLEMAKSGAYRLDMPYWLGLYDVGEFENGIHGIPVEWETGEKLWDGLIGQPATFGCAMLADDAAAFLFDASYLGMPVHVIE